MPEGAVVVKRLALASVAAVLVAGTLSSCVRLVENSSSDTSDITDGVATVRIQNGAGNVRVRSAEGASGTQVVRKLEYPKDADKPTGATHRLEGDVLVLDGCGSRCTASYEVTVPSKDVKVTGENSSGDVALEGVASVDATFGSGNTTLRDVAGAVNVKNSSGDLVASDIGGAFTGKLGSGNTRLSKMRGPVVVDDGSGDVDIELASPQSVNASAGSGNLTVRVPQGSYKVDADAGTGDKNLNGVKNDPGASVELVLRTDSGDLTLRTA
ncbi:hypothetical protein BN6_83410 [Saccharothrix espanaensis DSM 44229]|uniref:DUF4097 domain-containing protein n=2 Tax=Saccharothrix espanaensis TaxID=103731 RepID=K0KGB9_SACES|nr:hypothetical protein BN6_83410 [Saccharothrix espanaensis DSM 44229]